MRYLYIIVTIFSILAFDYSYSQKVNVSEKASKPTAVDFFKEEIILSISDSLVSVEGIYYFFNHTDREMVFPVIFPFYVDSLSSYPHFIDAYIDDGDKTIKLEYKHTGFNKGIRLGIPLKPKEVTVWNIDYKQRLKSHHAKYILTSTGIWGKPLKEATYCFIVPEDIMDVKIWPDADTVYTVKETRVYKAIRRNFMPTKDMEISWNGNG
ncbi:MAG: hypothetical protein B6D58_00470 [candidate division Zixibacteria bacterium 4484_95]|nr:MAG: hypothetical protein B6D58_00470 [candidate division Zixibacteria bacterium 4484_95]